MADSMFGFSTSIPTLGVGKMDGLSADEFEEEYDALNDETFGADVIDGDWEQGHEKLTGLEDVEHSPKKIDVLDFEQTNYHHYLDAGNDREIVHSLSRLMLDDDVDDPAIMGLARSKPMPTRDQSLHNVSPPPAAIVESDHVGSPSTNSIWSTGAATRVEHSKVQGRDAYVAAFLSSLKDPVLTLSNDDPCIVSATKDFHRSVATNDHHQSTTPKLIPNVRMVDEIERDMMLLEPHDRRKSPISSSSSTALLHEEVERDILLKPRVRTVSEIEREISASSGSERLSPRTSPVNQHHIIRPPPGLANGGALIHRPQLGPYVIHPVMHSVTSPLTIHGHRSVGNASHGMNSSPPPPYLLSMSPNSPPAFRVVSPATSPVWLHSYPANRMIPPQLTAYRRRQFYQSRGAPNGFPRPGNHQGFIFDQRRYPPMQVFPYVTRPLRPPPQIIGCGGNRDGVGGSGGGVGGGGFADPRQMRRFTHSGQLLIQQQQNQSRPRLQQKRNSWSEPGSHVPQFHPHFNNYNFNNNYDNGMNNGVALGADEDEYANLMTQREKDWLVKIQLMQLQTDNPYLDDFYYTTYVLKKKTKELDKDVESTLVIPERSKAESKIYQPTQFEGSLGRLQVLSVNCPRKIIDLGNHHSDDCDPETQKVTHRELKKFRQLLLGIEKLYGNYLEVDDIDKKAAALPEDSRATLLENKKQLIQRIHAGLIGSGGQDRFAQIMSVRKGRHLVVRVLPRFSKEQIDVILNLVLSNLAIILKKDHRDPVMPRIWSQMRGSLDEADLEFVVTLGLRTLNQNAESTCHSPLVPTRNHLNAFFTHEVGLRILDDLMQRVNQVIIDKTALNDGESELKQTWSKIVEHLADALVALPDASLAKSTGHLLEFVEHLRRFLIDESKVNSVIQRLE